MAKNPTTASLKRKTQNRSYHEKRQLFKRFFLTKDKIVRRNHKDTLFRYIFRDKANLLQLYNALNNTSYDDPEQLTITTLENVIYLGYKNDISFVIGRMMVLFEQQSTWNPNMPLRGVLYISRLISEYIKAMKYNMHSSTLITLPFIQFIVFYNGPEDYPERTIMRLSDAFEKPDSIPPTMKVPAIECQALVININFGKNQELLQKCKPLLDYSKFVFYVRFLTADGYSVEDAVNIAVDRCIEEGILTDVLTQHRKEVVCLFLEEYNQELHFSTLKQEGYDSGHADGYKIGHNEGYNSGHEEGYNSGHQEGYNSGHQEGYNSGHQEGYNSAIERIDALNQLLLEQNRIAELVQSSTNPNLREKLFKEFNL